MTKNWRKKITAELDQKLQFTVPILMPPRYILEVFSLKENIQHFKTSNFLIFSIFVDHFFALMDPDTDTDPMT